MKRPRRFADYDPAALEALTLAARLSESAGSMSVDSVRLAMALLVANSDASALLASHRVTPESLQAVAIEQHEHDVAGMSHVVRTVLDRAESEAQFRGDSRVTAMDLVLGLLLTGSPVADLLQQQGLSAEGMSTKPTVEWAVSSERRNIHDEQS